MEDDAFASSHINLLNNVYDYKENEATPQTDVCVRTDKVPLSKKNIKVYKIQTNFMSGNYDIIEKSAEEQESEEYLTDTTDENLVIESLNTPTNETENELLDSLGRSSENDQVQPEVPTPFMDELAVFNNKMEQKLLQQPSNNNNTTTTTTTTTDLGYNHSDVVEQECNHGPVRQVEQPPRINTMYHKQFVRTDPLFEQASYTTIERLLTQPTAFISRREQSTTKMHSPTLPLPPSSSRMEPATSKMDPSSGRLSGMEPSTSRIRTHSNSNRVKRPQSTCTMEPLFPSSVKMLDEAKLQTDVNYTEEMSSLHKQLAKFQSLLQEKVKESDGDDQQLTEINEFLMENKFFIIDFLDNLIKLQNDVKNRYCKGLAAGASAAAASCSSQQQQQSSTFAQKARVDVLHSRRRKNLLEKHFFSEKILGSKVVNRGSDDIYVDESSSNVAVFLVVYDDADYKNVDIYELLKHNIKRFGNVLIPESSLVSVEKSREFKHVTYYFVYDSGKIGNVNFLDALSKLSRLKKECFDTIQTFKSQIMKSLSEHNIKEIEACYQIDSTGKVRRPVQIPPFLFSKELKSTYQYVSKLMSLEPTTIRMLDLRILPLDHLHNMYRKISSYHRNLRLQYESGLLGVCNYGKETLLSFSTVYELGYMILPIVKKNRSKKRALIQMEET